MKCPECGNEERQRYLGFKRSTTPKQAIGSLGADIEVGATTYRFHCDECGADHTVVAKPSEPSPMPDGLPIGAHVPPPA